MVAAGQRGVARCLLDALGTIELVRPRLEEAFVSNPERRRSPRVAVQNHPALPSGIVDVGLGGLSVALPFVLPKGSVHAVGLQLSNGDDVVIRVRVRHRRRESRPGGADVFVTGLEFLADLTGQPTPAAFRVAS